MKWSYRKLIEERKKGNEFRQKAVSLEFFGSSMLQACIHPMPTTQRLETQPRKVKNARVFLKIHGVRV